MSVRGSARAVVVPPARYAFRGIARARSLRWPESSRLFALGDRSGWSVEEDADHLATTARRLGVEVAPPRWAPFTERQSVFFSSHFEAFSRRWLESSHRLGVAYLHGRPGTPGHPEFEESFEALRRQPDRIARIQVTHSEMNELVISAGVDPGCVFRIPIGIDLENFPLVDADDRALARESFGLDADAWVVGSFQKDGVGWGEGLEPKSIKGPDVLVESLEIAYRQVPELVVLLTGPARGYVRTELGRRGIPYRHHLANSRRELARAYYALDAYVVPSRQEGGPKAVLEAMAAGVALVSTRVGQAPDLVEHGRNGLLADVEDSPALAAGVARLHDDRDLKRSLVAAGRATAERYAYERLDPLWKKLLDGFVARGGPRAA